MMYSDELHAWYSGEEYKFKNVYIDSTMALFIVETSSNFEVARVFYVGDDLQINIDRKIQKGDALDVSAILIKHFLLHDYKNTLGDE